MTKEKDWKRLLIYVLPEEHMIIRKTALEERTSASEYVRTVLNKTGIFKSIQNSEEEKATSE